MVSITHNEIAKCWEVRFKGIVIRRAETRPRALQIALIVCDFYESGFFDGMTDEEIAEC